MQVIDVAVELLEKGIVFIRDFINTLVPGDIPLIIGALVIAYFIEKSKVESWKIWIPIGVVLFLLFKFAGT